MLRAEDLAVRLAILTVEATQFLDGCGIICYLDVYFFQKGLVIGT
jgi:hypothetical protein